MYGLKDTVTVYSRDATDDGYGGLVDTTETSVIASFKCRIARLSGQQAMASFGRNTAYGYSITGAPTTTAIISGYIIVDASANRYEIVHARKQYDEGGNFHHWLLLCEKLV